MLVWQDDIINGCATIEQVRWFFRYGSFDSQEELIIAIEIYLLKDNDRQIMKNYGFKISDILNNRLIEMDNYERRTKQFICQFAETMLRHWNQMLGYDYFGRQSRRNSHRYGSNLPDHFQD